jgi:hypothetical protein
MLEPQGCDAPRLWTSTGSIMALTDPVGSGVGRRMGMARVP